MSTHHNIKTFTAFDIEKYHKGLLSSKEMHDMEKAALDDPFLADALEGYGGTPVPLSSNLEELHQRLEQKSSSKQIVPPGSTRSFPWLRAAAMTILVAGAALLVYQFGFNNKKEDIAFTRSPQTVSPIPSAPTVRDSVVPANPPANTISGQAAETATTDKILQAPSPGVVTVKPEAGQSKVQSEQLAAPPAYKKEDGVSEDKDERQVNKTANAETNRVPAAKEERALQEEVVAQSGRFNDAAARKMRAQSNATNQFRGQVMDAHNNALPFANITNIADSVGTYADAKGNFVLTSPDSVLHVQVRSVGFENNVIQLQNQQAPNRVIMQEDNSVSQMVLNTRRVNASRARNNLTVEEPEPIDGWYNYDTYLANNLQAPEAIKIRKELHGEVQLSFEINNLGEPINITVDRSLCEACDKEAIRLVKEGPKWKRKTRRGRTSVTISF